GHTVAYTVSNAQKTTSAVDSASGINYATNALYDPTGALSGVVHGSTGTFSGITEGQAHNSFLQLTGIQAQSSAGAALNFSYNFPNPSGGFVSEDVGSITNNADTSRSQSFLYDARARLLSAIQGTAGANCWGYTFSEDPLGNLTSENLSQCSGGGLSLSVNG